MPSTINADDLGRVIKVDYDYEYQANDGKTVKITEGEEFVLIKKSNADWWQVIKKEQKKPLYVPAGYVRELQHKKFLDHPYFKKASNALKKSQKEEAKKNDVQKPVVKPRTKPLNDSNKSSNNNSSFGSERMIVLAGSREDLSVFSGYSNKFSEMRASTDSLDRFIENENPYDEVPFEPLLSPQERQLKLQREKEMQNHLSDAKENMFINEDEHDYENIQEIVPSARALEMNNTKQTSDLRKHKMGNTPSELGFRDSPDPPPKPTNRTGSNKPSTRKDITCLEVMNDGWEKQVDNHTGNMYYYNSVNGEMRLTPPFQNETIKVSPPMSPKDDSDHLLKADNAMLLAEEHKRPSLLQRRKTSPARFKNSKRIPLGHKKHAKKSSEDSMNINNNNNTNFTADLQKRLSPKQTKSLSPTRNNWSSPVLGRRKESFTSSSTTSRSLSPDPTNNGWRRERSVDGDTVYVHEFTGERWMEIYDHASGSYYYCNEATRVTAWDLPQSKSSSYRATTIVPPPHPMIEKQGRLYWTKLAEAGKKTRKNWIQQWVVLLANNLLFYKDQRQATVTKSSPLGKPESSCDLRGSIIQWAKDKSSKKNVFQIKTVRGLQLLLQHDDLIIVTQWYKSIEAAIEKTNQREPIDQSLMNRKFSHGSSEDDEKDGKKKKDKDKKKKSKAPSRHGSDAKNADKVRSKLKKFIGRRPTMEMLQEKGIIKENVFGCPLQKLAEKEDSTIPKFVKMCVEEVEKRGLNVDGIYRVSGNLSHVQKLRYAIDREEPVDFSDHQWEDIHVITGALKMFLRELPEPVIPFNFFDKFINTCTNHQDNVQGRINSMKQLIKSLPKPNRDTLKYLMNHFRIVCTHSSSNRMQVQNIAIVFGPTLLLKPPNEQSHDPAGSNMAVYMMYQNQIVDFMLTEYDQLFA